MATSGPKTGRKPASSNLAVSLSTTVTNGVCLLCKKGDLQGLAALIKGKGIMDIVHMLNYTDRNGSTPLFHCCWNGDVSMIEFMIEHGADVHWPNFRQNYAIDMAIETNRVEAVAKLLRYGAEVTQEHWKTLRGRMSKRNGVTKVDVGKMEELLTSNQNFLAKGSGRARRPPGHSEEEKAEAGNVGYSKFGKATPDLFELAVSASSHIQSGTAFVEFEAGEDDMPDQFSEEAAGHMPYLPDEYKQKLYRIFDDCDLNSDHQLSLEEVFAMNTRLEPGMDEKTRRADAENFMAYVDIDENQSVSVNEWVKAWEKLIANEGLAPLQDFVEGYREALTEKGERV